MKGQPYPGRRLRLLAAWLLVGMLMSFQAPDRGVQATPADFPIPGGHFYSQTAGGTGDQGFSVLDVPARPFWSEFQRLGGVESAGYPISQPFAWEAQPAQAFQKAIFRWNPERSAVDLVNVFDLLHDAGQDDRLLAIRSVPPMADWRGDTGLDWPAVADRHLALLDGFPTLRAAYFAVDDPILRHGLPMAPVADFGSVRVLRAQRAVLQEWREDRPWARAGAVTVANGGDLAKEFGLLPAGPLQPIAAPVSSASLPEVTLSAEPAVSSGEPIQLTMRLVNTTNAAFQLVQPSSLDSDFAVTRNGQEVWRWSLNRVFLTVITTTELQPGESREYRATWSPRDNFDRPVPLGEYQIVGEIPNNPPLRSAPVTVTVQ